MTVFYGPYTDVFVKEACGSKSEQSSLERNVC